MSNLQNDPDFSYLNTLFIHEPIHTSFESTISYAETSKKSLYSHSTKATVRKQLASQLKWLFPWAKKTGEVSKSLSISDTDAKSKHLKNYSPTKLRNVERLIQFFFNPAVLEALDDETYNPVVQTLIEFIACPEKPKSYSEIKGMITLAYFVEFLIKEESLKFKEIYKEEIISYMLKEKFRFFARYTTLYRRAEILLTNQPQPKNFKESNIRRRLDDKKFVDWYFDHLKRLSKLQKDLANYPEEIKYFSDLQNAEKNKDVKMNEETLKWYESINSLIKSEFITHFMNEKYNFFYPKVKEELSKEVIKMNVKILMKSEEKNLITSKNYLQLFFFRAKKFLGKKSYLEKHPYYVKYIKKNL
ncbi:expressed protein [Phakopsora pachyrhizi]|uniref:Expressed protein n=1 Tax=Phakopsora pachyrhizi TaxID=170000 RepID=A0AAV0BAM5_PHAPC|nr:expressed protein [Phakopsora pachyrhizi]